MALWIDDQQVAYREYKVLAEGDAQGNDLSTGEPV
jgi:hypothetical protein